MQLAKNKWWRLQSFSSFPIVSLQDKNFNPKGFHLAGNLVSGCCTLFKHKLWLERRVTEWGSGCGSAGTHCTGEWDLLFFLMPRPKTDSTAKSPGCQLRKRLLGRASPWGFWPGGSLRRRRRLLTESTASRAAGARLAKAVRQDLAETLVFDALLIGAEAAQSSGWWRPPT